jgi:hypothetical protein
MMENATRLVPLAPERARELLGLMREAQAGDGRALALDAEGRVLGVVGADDPEAEHLLGDLDVHA